METEPFLRAFREELEAAVATGDEALLQAGERLGRALDASLRLLLMDAIGRAALELSDQLPSGRVDVRLAGRDVQLVYVGDDVPPPPPEPDEAGTARITLRLPEALKQRVESAAANEGVSTNAWLVRAVGRGLDHRRSAMPRRITGFAES
jgi:hypothetical protein